ncbi:hypothetical protein L8R85_06800 [Vibrio splendidus]|uniref:Uncharacterized protein n=1 Tax=Vibrio splendidus TaxID=29497 RepID=A0AA43G038_VIBSP|nr:hypothetical protein [Vibrio splendidus]MDH5920735.1 hypothetical protein [Vibrio splendidus]
MKTLVGLSNFSFETQQFGSFGDIRKQLEKLKSLNGNFSQHGVSLAVATDILKDNYFGPSLEVQFKNFSYGQDRMMIAAFKSLLERNYFSGFIRQYTGLELKKLASSPDLENQTCCTIYAPKVLVSGFSSIKCEGDFASYYEQILGEFPISESSYYERATSHFTNIIYQDDCEITLNRVVDGFCNYSVAITRCLKALNDSSPTNAISMQDKLGEVKAKTKYKCTPEGNSHPHFKFPFTHGGKSYLALDCQFHLKPSDKNSSGNSSFNHKRVYFGYIPRVCGKEWDIAVAAIGPHISTHDSRDRFAPPRVKRK